MAAGNEDLTFGSQLRRCGCPQDSEHLKTCDLYEVKQVPCPECGQPMSEKTDLCASCMLKQYNETPADKSVVIEGDT